MRQWLVVGLVVGVVAVAAAQADLSEDSALQKPITLWLPLTTLAEALQAAQEQTGVSLRCQDALREAKVALYVENRPAWEILTRLANLLGYRWRKREEGGYTLYLPDETRRALVDALNQDKQATEQALREMLKTARELLRMPPEKRAAELERYGKLRTYSGYTSYEEMLLQEPITTALDVPPQSAIYQWLEFWLREYAPQGEPPRLMRDLGGDESASVLHCLAEADERALQQLLEGRTVGFSTRPAPGVFPLHTRVTLPFMLRRLEAPDPTRSIELDPQTGTLRPAGEFPNPELGGLWVKLSPWGDLIEAQIVGFHKPREGETAAGVYLWEIRLTIPQSGYLAQTAVWKHWREWATPLSELQARLKDRAPLNRPKPQRVPDKPLTVAEALEWLAWHTGCPIISDASRYDDASYARLLDNPQALLTLLSRELWLRMDEDGYLLARHKRFWMKQQYEVPERLLRPLEAKWLRGEWLELEDYVRLAGGLTDAQARGFSYLDIRLIAAFDTTPLYMGMPALRFLAALGAQQYARARSGEWVPEATLTIPQRAKFRAALNGDFPPPENLFMNAPALYDYYLVSGLFPDAEEGGKYPHRLQEALQQAPELPAFRIAALQPYAEFRSRIATPEDTLEVQTYFAQQARLSRPEEPIDWAKVFGGADRVPHEGEVERHHGVLVEFSAPPRQFQRYLFSQTRHEKYARAQ